MLFWCDVIYDKHVDGFWPTLRALCREACTPIIICEDISLVRKQLGFEVQVLIFPLIRPEELCAALGISVPIPVLLWLNSTTVIYGHVSISFSFTLGKIAM
uniref:Uncharacterized protein n=1 Tax=Wuchereria bancrofti TaxID=6293 RepID=A0A1I8EPW0_WUCBA